MSSGGVSSGMALVLNGNSMDQDAHSRPTIELRKLSKSKEIYSPIMFCKEDGARLDAGIWNNLRWDQTFDLLRSNYSRLPLLPWQDISIYTSLYTILHWFISWKVSRFNQTNQPWRPQCMSFLTGRRLLLQTSSLASWQAAERSTNSIFMWE